MTQNFDFYSSIVMYSFMAVVLIVSLLFCYRKYNPDYLAFFPIYHLVAIVTEVIGYLFYYNQATGLTTTNHPFIVFTLFEFVFFSLFISEHLTNKKYKWIFYFLASIVSLISIWYVRYTLDIDNAKLVVPMCLLYIIGAGLYFINAFSDLKYKNIAKEPVFWIMSGILAYSVAVTPTFFIIAQLWKFFGEKSFDTYMFLYRISNISGYIFLYLLFIKAYTCRTFEKI